MQDEEDVEAKSRTQAEVSTRELRPRSAAAKPAADDSQAARPSPRKTARRKQDEEEQGPFCICRRGVAGMFMVCCDQCQEWFHTKCLGLKAKPVQRLPSFFCPACRDQLGMPTVEEDIPQAVSAKLRAAMPAPPETPPPAASPLKSSPSKPKRAAPTSPHRAGMATRASKRQRTGGVVIDDADADVSVDDADDDNDHHDHRRRLSSDDDYLIDDDDDDGDDGDDVDDDKDYSETSKRDKQLAAKSSADEHRVKLHRPASGQQRAVAPRRMTASRQAASKQENLRLRSTDSLGKALAGVDKDGAVGVDSEAKIHELAATIEGLLFQQCQNVDAQYHSKIRTLVFNLKQNAQLRQQVLSHDLPPERLVTMDSAELACSELQSMRRELEEEAEQEHIISTEAVDPDHPLFGVIHEPVAAPQSKGDSVQENFVISHATMDLIRSSGQQRDDDDDDDDESSSSSSSSSVHSTLRGGDNDVVTTPKKKKNAASEQQLPVFHIPSFDTYTAAGDQSSDDDDNNDDDDRKSQDSNGGAESATALFSPRTPPGSPPAWAYPDANLLAGPSSWYGEMGKDVVRRFAMVGYTLVDVQPGQRPFRDLMPRTIHTKGRMERDKFLAYLNDLERSTSTKRAVLLLQPTSDEDKDCYAEFVTYYRSKNRVVVVSSGASSQIREMFLLPLAASDELPPVVQAAFQRVPQRTDSLLCVLVLYDVARSKPKPAAATVRAADSFAMPAHETFSELEFAAPGAAQLDPAAQFDAARSAAEPFSNPFAAAPAAAAAAVNPASLSNEVSSFLDQFLFAQQQQPVQPAAAMMPQPYAAYPAYSPAAAQPTAATAAATAAPFAGYASPFAAQPAVRYDQLGRGTFQQQQFPRPAFGRGQFQQPAAAPYQQQQQFAAYPVAGRAAFAPPAPPVDPAQPTVGAHMHPSRLALLSRGLN